MNEQQWQEWIDREIPETDGFLEISCDKVYKPVDIESYLGQTATKLPDMYDKPLTDDEIRLRRKEAKEHGEELTQFEIKTGIIPSTSKRREKIRAMAQARGFFDEYHEQDHLWLKGIFRTSSTSNESE